MTEIKHTLPGIHLEDQYADVKDAIDHANRTSPLAYVDRGRWPQPVEVATLRDQFAMAATDEDIKLYVWEVTHGDRAKARYLFADAMLAARREG